MLRAFLHFLRFILQVIFGTFECIILPCTEKSLINKAV